MGGQMGRWVDASGEYHLAVASAAMISTAMVSVAIVSIAIVSAAHPSCCSTVKKHAPSPMRMRQPWNVHT